VKVSDPRISIEGMKLMTATALTQGQRDNDYHWCVEGELVRFDVTCARDRYDPDGGCGCGRGFAGMSSRRATTTVLIRDLDLTECDVRLALAASLHAAGYHDDPDATADVADEARELIELARSFEVGDVLERRLDEIRVRSSAHH